MRVIAGSAKGRRLKTVRGTAVRPTADRTKEALFSIVESRVGLTGAHVIDLFAGSGGLGIEALSRGAVRAVFVERDPRAVQVLRANLDACGFTASALVRPVAVLRALAELSARGEQFDVVLADPPYRTELLAETLQKIGELDLVRPLGGVIVERHVEDVLPERYGRLRLTQTRRYGKTSLDLYRLEKGPDEPEDV